MPLKILFLSHAFYPSLGGIEVNSEILAQAFQEAGHAVHLVTWSTDPSEKVFPYVVLRNPSKRSLIREHQWADVVFENNPCLRLAWPNLFWVRPSVIALNTWVARVDGTIGLQDRVKSLWFKRAGGLIAVSEAIRERCWPAATVIGNPYRVSDFKLMPEIERSRDFVFLGRLVSDKGADQAVRALQQVALGMPEAAVPSLTIVGDGPEREPLEQLVAELGLSAAVRFTGSLRGEALARCLNGHRFLLVPSVWEEPFGNVALEGIACGCVPIVSDGGGLPDAVGKAGLTFSRGDVAALAGCMRQVLRSPALEAELRAAAPGHLAGHHPQRVAQRYLEMIEAVSRRHN